MTRNKNLRLDSRWIAVASFIAILGGCSGDDGDPGGSSPPANPGTGGTGLASGAGGDSGTNGASATGGSGGSSATGGVGGSSGSTAGMGATSGGSGPVGDVPCSGCAGDVCSTNSECLDGFVCNRIDPQTAWCTNCTALDCSSHCTADVNCGEGGRCLDGYCYHACSADADCPPGHTCHGSTFCAPANLPKLDQDCATDAAFFCEPSLNEERTCVYTGADPIRDPGTSWCSRECSTDNDCADLWILGCCRALESGSFCLRREYC
jgi:hypothetical protein